MSLLTQVFVLLTLIRVFQQLQRFEGPIPEMVDWAETHVMATMRKSSLIEGMFRRDILEYPQAALREAIANAIAHRDYSSYVRGSYIQIRMFADRLEIQSPGGLFGNVTVENIEGKRSGSHAAFLRFTEGADSASGSRDGGGRW